MSGGEREYFSSLFYCPNIGGGLREYNDHMANILHSSQSNEWYTPPHIIEIAHLVMGGIDLDPATSLKANGIVRASQIYTIEDDGLSKNWGSGTSGTATRVWLNPPYGGQTARWVSYAVSEFASERIGSLMLLVNATPDAKWFRKIWDSMTVCFLYKRVRFMAADGVYGPSPTHGSALCFASYDGDQVDAFINAVNEIGHVCY